MQFEFQHAPLLQPRVHFGSKKRKMPLPSALARYNAMSAFFSSVSGSDPSAGTMAMPMLTPTMTWWPSTSYGTLRTSMIRCASTATSSTRSGPT